MKIPQFGQDGLTPIATILKRQAAIEEGLRIRRRLLHDAKLWDTFPRKMRKFFIAQFSKCPYCGSRISLGFISGKAHLRIATWDHVFPRCRHANLARNRILACRDCNLKKGAREPYACEVLFCRITHEIARALK